MSQQVRSARTFAGYQAVFCDKLGQPSWRALSAGAAGCLFELRLLADRDVLVAGRQLNHGKIRDPDTGFFWGYSLAAEWLEDRFMALSCDVAEWLGALVAQRFIEFDEREELVVLDFVVDDLRKAGNLVRVDSQGRGGVASGFSGGGEGDDMGGSPRGRSGGGFAGLSYAPARGGTVAPASVRSFAPAYASSPPPLVEDVVGLEVTRVGGKGGVYSENTVFLKHQTPNPNFQTPNQNQRANANANGLDGEAPLVGGGDEAYAGDSAADIVWKWPVLRAAQKICRQSSLPFNRTVEARVREFGEQTVRMALEAVSDAFRDAPQSIKFRENGKAVGGPLLWMHISKLALGKRKVGF